MSIRQVAAKAGVNPGLIHRYIGSKEELLRAVLENFATQLEDNGTRVLHGPLSQGTERLMLTHQRIIAHLILEGYDINDFYTRTPLVAIILDAIQRETAVDDHTARIRAVQILALGLGWRLFESFLTSATGLDDADRDEIQAAIRKTNFAIGRGELAVVRRDRAGGAGAASRDGPPRRSPEDGSAQPPTTGSTRLQDGRKLGLFAPRAFMTSCSATGS